VVVFGAAALFLVRVARPSLGALSALPWPPGWGDLAASAGFWLVSYTSLVLLWAASLPWWSTQLERLVAIRMFFVANLARYIPGGIWQFTGLAALAIERGVSPLAVTAAVLIQQLVLLGTGVLCALITAPALLGPRAAALPTPVAVAAGVVGVGILAFAFPTILRHLKQILERVTGRAVPLPHAPARQFAGYVAGTTLGWLGYGASFWLFVRALLGNGAPGAVTCGSAFVASYVAGIVAVFAPGGLVVREAAIVAALSPHVGAERALVLAVANRLWLTILEILATLSVLVASRARAGPPHDRRQEIG